jgi:hypothetical protein
MTHTEDKLREAGGRGSWSSAHVFRSSVSDIAERQLVRWHVFRPGSRPVVKWQSILAAVAIVTGALFLLMGAVSMWDHGGGRGSAAVDVIWWVVWIVYSLARVALIGVVAMVIYQWIVSRRRSAASAASPKSSGR